MVEPCGLEVPGHWEWGARGVEAGSGSGVSAWPQQVPTSEVGTPDRKQV